MSQIFCRKCSCFSETTTQEKCLCGALVPYKCQCMYFFHFFFTLSFLINVAIRFPTEDNSCTTTSLLSAELELSERCLGLGILTRISGTT